MRDYFLPLLVFTGITLVLLGQVKASDDVDQPPKHDHSLMTPEVARFYETWNMPPNRQHSCCNKDDCFVAQIERRRDGLLYYLHAHNGLWFPLPVEKLEHEQDDPRDSPDGQNHVCAHIASGHVYCAVLGGGG